MHFEALVLPEFDFRHHFKRSLETQRLARVKMHIGDIRRSHHAEVFGVELLLQKLGDHVLQHMLPDVAGKLLANNAGRSFSRPEAREFGALLYVGSHAVWSRFPPLRQGWKSQASACNLQLKPSGFNLGKEVMV